ncbi:MAG: hypothetical protein CFE44_01035 [Burkholderiales bacterium PBB4]|nr:MAG: hypothetical protein CFE44_01035 [Burkholderiales bacterium PBB4]
MTGLRLTRYARLMVARARRSAAVNDRVQVVATRQTLGRLVIVAMVLVSISVLYVVWFWGLQLGSATGRTRWWVQAVGAAHLANAVVLASLGWMARRHQRSPQTDRRKAWVVQVAFVTATLLFLGVSLSLADQWVAANTTMYALVSLSAAMLSLMRPVAACVLHFGMYALLYLCLPLTQADAQMLAISRSHAFAATLVSLLASALMWRQYVQATLLGWEVEHAQSKLTAKQAELEYLATHDALTGLVNRREFMRQLELEHLRTQRHPSPTSLIMVDLDFFKKINDTHGHPAGDAVLIAVASALRLGVRKSDLPARLGGEEFVVLLPHTDLAGAEGVAQKLLAQIRALTIPCHDVQLRVTASMGVSCVSTAASPIDALYAAADQALYVAKHCGRDRVELASHA